MSTRGTSGGAQSRAPRLHALGERELNSFPPLPSGSIFERGEIAQSAVDILSLGSIALLLCAFAAAFGVLGYVLYLSFVPQLI